MSGERRYVSRGGRKLEHAIGAFGLDPSGVWCADLGCSTGGFVDAWLRAGAARVVAVDTGYGVLDYSLRRDERVLVMERSNALHAPPHGELVDAGGAGFVSVDLSWTPQHLALPAAAGWCGEGGRIVTLVKPHYEASSALWRDEFGGRLADGVLAEGDAEAVTSRVLAHAVEELGFVVEGVERSPIAGGKSSKRKAGNAEWLALVRPVAVRLGKIGSAGSDAGP